MVCLVPSEECETGMEWNHRRIILRLDADGLRSLEQVRP